MHPFAPHFEAVAKALRRKRRVTIKDIQHATARHFGITMVDLLSDRRHITVVRPRQIAIALCSELTTRSLPVIARSFGNRDRTTIMHAISRIKELRKEDDDIDSDYIAVKRLAKLAVAASPNLIYKPGL